MTLFLVCDTSGSMSEGGKPFITRTAVTTIAQWIHLAGGGVQVRLCAWGSEAVFSDWTITDDYPEHMLVCGGTSNATALTRLLGVRTFSWPRPCSRHWTDGWKRPRHDVVEELRRQRSRPRAPGCRPPQPGRMGSLPP